jgi:hypothetical protein
MCKTAKVWQTTYNNPRVEMKEWKHAVFHQAAKVCVSKEAVPECARGYMAVETEATEVDFVCLPAASKATKVITPNIFCTAFLALIFSAVPLLNLFAQMMVAKAYKGERIAEVANLAKTLTTTLELPKACIAA